MTPEQTVARSYARIRAHGDDAIFISLRPEAEALAEARALTDKSLPLYGIPVGIKDNIDVAGLPTTAACPAISLRPEAEALAEARALTDKSLPLYGIPVGIKDNIDVAGLPTTAACPAFS